METTRSWKALGPAFLLENRVRENNENRKPENFLSALCLKAWAVALSGRGARSLRES